MPGPIQSIQRAAAVIELLGAVNEPLPLGELARLLDLPKPTAHGILRTLCDVGYVWQTPDTGHYTLSRVLAVVGGSFDPHLLRARALNWADGLAAGTGQEVQLAIPRGQQLEIVHHVFRPDRTPQRLRVGELQPLHATALGRVLLAHSPISSRLQRLDLVGFTARTTTTQADLARELRTTRRQGWAAVDGELVIGTAAVAAPVRHRTGVVVGALAVVGRRERVLDVGGAPLPDLLGQLLTAVEAVSENLQERL